MKTHSGPWNLILLKDPFWGISIACYIIHRFWQVLSPDSGWMDRHWNDLWMLPCALPLILSLYGALGMRAHALRVTGGEILWHGLLWGFMAEFIGPLLFDHAVSDLWDLLAYALGGFLMFFRWHCTELRFSSIALRI